MSLLTKIPTHINSDGSQLEISHLGKNIIEKKIRQFFIKMIFNKVLL